MNKNLGTTWPYHGMARSSLEIILGREMEEMKMNGAGRVTSRKIAIAIILCLVLSSVVVYVQHTEIDPNWYEVFQGEAGRLYPIPCFEGNDSNPSFYWHDTAETGIWAYVSQSPTAPLVKFRDEDKVSVEWCGTRAEVGILHIIIYTNKVRVFLELYDSPKNMETGPDIPSWPTPGPTPTISP